jgi:hypothetical protein
MHGAQSVVQKLAGALGLAVLLGALAAPAAAAPIVYSAPLSGLNEVPPNASTANGFAMVTVDGFVLSVEISFIGLSAPAAAGHIHCCAAAGNNAGVAVGFPDFPSATIGDYNRSFDLLDATVYTANFMNNVGGGSAAGAADVLLAGLRSGLGYVNLHNASFPAGEIRGQLVALPLVPTLWLMAAGVVGLAARRRKLS